MTNKEVTKTDICKQIIEKIDLILPGISDSSKRDMDLMIAQTVQALSEVYKNLKDVENDAR